jgi:Cell division protein
MTKYLTLIFKNLLRTKRRTILTILSIAVSLFIFSVLVSLPTFANQMLADTTSSVRILCRTKMGLGYPLPVGLQVQNCHDSPCRCRCTARDLRRHLP